jgi:transcriptional regulator with XRE-family HTH domain
VDRNALAEFLSRHRESLQPADVGLSPGARRRVPGLRRDEVALLASMSTDYYSRLEQRRGPQPSTQMLAALARALRLTDAEGDYLFRVAGHSAPDRVFLPDFVAPSLQRVLDRLSDTPAVIFSALGETLLQNEPARALLGDVSEYTGFERSSVYRWFVRPEVERWRYPEEARDKAGRSYVAMLRAALGLMGTQSRAGEMARELSRLSPEFTEIWDRQEVTTRFAEHKTLIHPSIGPIDVDCQVLFTEDQSQTLLVLTAPPRSDAESKLRLLTVVGSQVME